MTKKHFEALAREIARIPDAAARQEAAFAVARACAPFNRSFDSVRFYAACGLGE